MSCSKQNSATYAQWRLSNCFRSFNINSLFLRYFLPKIPTLLNEFLSKETLKTIGISLWLGTLYSQVPFVIKSPDIELES